MKPLTYDDYAEDLKNGNFDSLKSFVEMYLHKSFNIDIVQNPNAFDEKIKCIKEQMEADSERMLKHIDELQQKVNYFETLSDEELKEAQIADIKEQLQIRIDEINHDVLVKTNINKLLNEYQEWTKRIDKTPFSLEVEKMINAQMPNQPDDLTNITHDQRIEELKKLFETTKNSTKRVEYIEKHYKTALEAAINIYSIKIERYELQINTIKVVKESYKALL